MRDPLIYPALPTEPIRDEQISCFVPLFDEVRWARDHTRAPGRQLELLVLLKTFQFLGYFATPIQIAPAILAAIARRLELHAPEGTFSVAPASLCRSRAVIRHHLGFEHWNAANKRLLVTRLVSLNQGRTGPNDLLNAAVEYLRRAAIELPAMRTLRRLIGRDRAAPEGPGPSGARQPDDDSPWGDRLRV